MSADNLIGPDTPIVLTQHGYRLLRNAPSLISDIALRVLAGVGDERSASQMGFLEIDLPRLLELLQLLFGAGLVDTVIKPVPRPANSSPAARKLPDGEKQIYSDSDPFADLFAASARDANAQNRLFRIWYGTNREALRTDGKLGYSGNRGSGIDYGFCTVYVPTSHRFGEIGSSWIRRLFSGEDDRIKLRATARIDHNDFWFVVHGYLAGLVEQFEHRALVYIHGYNVSFEDAAIRAAQLGFDLRIPATYFFSWPSKGTLAGYPADEASIEASEIAIKDFLVDVLNNCGARQVHVIAHSMGNRGFLRAARLLGTERHTLTRTFDQVILAAPDVDSDVFKTSASQYVSISRRTTLYASAKDKAVEASQWLHDFARAGFIPPVTIVSGIDTIEVTNIDLSRLARIPIRRDLLTAKLASLRDIAAT